MIAVVQVTEFTDPGCPWSWAAEPRLRWLRDRYGEHVAWRRVFGVQMDGAAGADAADAPELVRERWLQIAAHSGAPITERLERAHASTRPAALAAKASERQGAEVADATLRRLREAFFVTGRPADRPQLIAEAVDRTEGLDVERLLDDLADPDLQAALQADFDEASDPDPRVVGLTGPGPHPGAAKTGPDRTRYGFPTVIVTGPAGRRIVPGWRPPAEYRAAVEAVAPELRELPQLRLTATEALERHGSLCTEDLVLLTGAGVRPPGAVAIATSTTPLWVAPDHPLASSDRALVTGAATIKQSRSI